MLLTDITKIVRVLLGAFSAVASQDELTQRRIGQIGEVIGAVDDVSATEAEPDSTIVDKRVEEAHDIIHRVAEILAMEEGSSEGEGNDGGGGGDNENAAAGVNTGQSDNELLAEVPWDGKLEGETFELTEDCRFSAKMTAVFPPPMSLESYRHSATVLRNLSPIMQINKRISWKNTLNNQLTSQDMLEKFSEESGRFALTIIVGQYPAHHTVVNDL